jgi:FkbM family methyltransferase
MARLINHHRRGFTSLKEGLSGLLPPSSLTRLLFLGIIMMMSFQIRVHVRQCVDDLSSLLLLSSQNVVWTSPHMVDCTQVDMPESEIYIPTTTKNSFLMNIHDPSSDEISRNIQKDGCWECSHIRALEETLEKHPDASFLDIGGNIGMWTLAASALGRNTYTIEPNRLNYERICRSINKNGFHPVTHVLNVAATAMPTSLKLGIPKGNLGGTSVRQVEAGDTTSPSSSSGAGIVQGVPIRQLGLPTDRPYIIKIDVEGFEMEAMDGALDFLRQVRIVYFAMELRHVLLTSHRKTVEIFDVLSSKGLVPFRINYEDENALDPKDLTQWIHFKHPKVRYFDVIWRLP